MKVKLLSVLLVVSVIAVGQTPPKKLKLKGEFNHKATSTILPSQLADLTLREVWSFNGTKENIGAKYVGTSESQGVSVYIYPAGNSGTEGRLRTEFQNAEYEISQTNPQLKPVSFHHRQHKGTNYTSNAFNRNYESIAGIESELTIYECGTWFLKIRISGFSEEKSLELESAIVEIVDPSRLTGLEPLVVQTDCHIAPGAFRDEYFLGSVIASSLASSAFAMDSIPTEEGASGFPDIYLGYHLARINHYEPPEKLKDKPKTPATEEFISQVEILLSSGFVEEFIMDQYDRLLVIDESMELDYDGFNEWIVQNPISIDLNQKFYVNSFNTE